MAVVGDFKILEVQLLARVKECLPKPKTEKKAAAPLSTDKLDFLAKVKKEELERIKEAEKRSQQPAEERGMEEIATTVFVDRFIASLNVDQKKKLLEKNIKGLKDIVSSSFSGDCIVVTTKQGYLELTVHDVALEAVKENFDELKKALFKE